LTAIEQVELAAEVADRAHLLDEVAGLVGGDAAQAAGAGVSSPA
jgi:hypothetical protein